MAGFLFGYLPLYASFSKKICEETVQAAPAVCPAPAQDSPSLHGMRFLCAEDNEINAEILQSLLEMRGASCTICRDGAEVVEKFRTVAPGEYDAILMDVQMPGMDGYELCRRLRSKTTVPVLFLSARDTELDKVVGLEIGGDDYLAKPFGVRELIARVRALLRRSGAAVQRQAAKSPLTVGHIRLDPNERSAWKDGVPVDLTAKEFDLMELLMRNPGRVYSRENMLDRKSVV